MRNLALLIALIATASDYTSLTGRWTSGKLNPRPFKAQRNNSTLELFTASESAPAVFRLDSNELQTHNRTSTF